ncbi:hypothetical protein IFM46972_03546 [Aspergillus udagawae]|uniref:Uncharacterized protein n=1 Tax=Aspergillus udagawae TaxID=91492 RepID=A0A8H3NEM1_9EURO|nr:hypothetical protein IFM46972_03546 [Aspergillus udagawae]
MGDRCRASSPEKRMTQSDTEPSLVHSEKAIIWTMFHAEHCAQELMVELVAGVVAMAVRAWAIPMAKPQPW